MGNYLQANNTLMYHIVTLTFSWCIAVNISAILALYKHRVFGYHTHAIISWLVIILTMVSALIYLIPKGIPTQCQFSGKVQCDQFQFPLAIEGSILLVWIAVQIFSGILARYWQQDPKTKTLRVMRSKRFHQFSGWFIMLLGKVNCFVHWRAVPQVYAPLLAWEVATIGLYIWRKYFFTTLETVLVDPLVAETTYEIPKIRYTEKLTKGKVQYVIFADYVYEITPLRTLHPAGFEIVEAVKGRQIDRFIYGMYSAESLPEVPTFSHPLSSFSLTGSPVAQIDNPNPYYNMEDLNPCMLSHKELVSEKTQIYILGLTSLSGKSFRYTGYSEINQIGQYFSLTINKKTTRLYTTVNCLVMSNRRIMHGIIAEHPLLNFNNMKIRPEGILEIRFKTVNTDNSSEKAFSEREITGEDDQGDNMIPIMIRKYDKGILTPLLVAETAPEDLIISKTRGQGLKLDLLAPGRLIFIAGGTGFYPFMDIVDLLFKKKILGEKALSAMQIDNIQKLNPILSKPFLEDFTFLLYIAINTADDFHPMTLYQLNALCSKDFQCVFRIRDKKEDFQATYPRFSLTDKNFDEITLPDIVSEDSSKTFICGPPIMATALIHALKKAGVPEQKYEFV